MSDHQKHDHRLSFPLRPFYSLRARMQAAAIIVVLIPMAIATWSTVNSLRRHLIEDVHTSLGVDLEIAALSFANQFEKLRTVVRTVSLDNTVKTTLRLDILPQLEKHINSLAELHSLDALAVLDANGRVIAALKAANIPDPDLKDHPLVAAALAGNEAGGSILEQHHTILSIIERAGGEIESRPVFMQATAQPIIIRNQVIGVIFGALLITDNSELVNAMRSASGTDDVTLVAGNRVAISTCALAGNGVTGARRFHGSLDYDAHSDMFPGGLLVNPNDASENMYAYRLLKDMKGEPVGAIVCLRNASKSMSILSEIRQRMLLVFLCSTVVALALLFLLARKISNPIQRLSRAMNALGRGDLSQRVEVSGQDEISDLARGFNTMSATINGRIKDLDKEIKIRLETEKQLAAETERLAVTLRSIGDGFIATDVQGRVVLMNRVVETLTGIDQQQATGRPVDNLCILKDPVTQSKIACPVMSVLAGNTIPTNLPDALLTGAAGREFLVTQAVSPLLDSQQNLLGAIIVIRDVTVQRKNEEELMRAQKLESVGQLAGGIAHDFNNLLTSILGNISLAQLRSDENSFHYPLLVEAEKASLQARDLTQQLLTFAKGGAPRLEIIAPGDLIIESCRLMLSGSKVEGVFDISKDLWPVKADQGQLSQVINNLVINGIHAMPTGGVLKVRAENKHVTDDDLPALPAGNYVSISIEDHGVGIPPEQLSRIFEPYYSTKKMGSGLGLATSYSIINKHRGVITVESEEGKGSAFTIHLPASPETEIPVAATAIQSPSTPMDRLRVLIMDDEKTVRTVGGKMIESLGHEVATARDGDSAIELYRREMAAGRPFDLVIMDLTIPGGMGGEETLPHLLTIDPGVVAIVSSGYSDSPVMAHPAEYGFKGVVGKPYSMAELEQVLAESLKKT